MKLVFTQAAALVLIAVSAMAQGPAARRDGNWQVTMEMEMPGMMRYSGGPAKYSTTGTRAASRRPARRRRASSLGTKLWSSTRRPDAAPSPRRSGREFR